MKILQERRFKEYATGNRKHRREGVAHSGSRQDVKTAEHYSGAPRGMWHDLTSSEEQPSDCDDASSSRCNRYGDGKRRRNDADVSRGETHRQQGAAAVAHYRQERVLQGPGGAALEAATTSTAVASPTGSDEGSVQR